VSNMNVSECLDGRTKEDGGGGQCITNIKFGLISISLIL
jgi:hypothetical protein